MLSAVSGKFGYIWKFGFRFQFVIRAADQTDGGEDFFALQNMFSFALDRHLC